MKAPKIVLTLDILRESKAELIGVFHKNGDFCKPFTNTYPIVDLMRQGFYFFVNKTSDEVSARFYMGRRRSECGFENGCLRKIRKHDTKVGEAIMLADTSFDVYYISSEKMKRLTTAFGKGKMLTMMTSSHNDRYQNLEEMNRMLNDNFKFEFQKY